MRSPRSVRSAAVAICCALLCALLGAVALVGVAAAPSFAMTEDQCLEKAADAGDTCADFDNNGNYTLVQGSGDSFGNDDFGNGDDFGIPGWFIALFVLAAVGGVATTIWRMNVARGLARAAGMDPDVAAGMTLLDEDGLSATYLASSLRGPQQAQQPPAPAAPVPASAESRLAEIKRLLDGGLITQVEYDARRKAIVDSL